MVAGSTSLFVSEYVALNNLYSIVFKKIFISTESRIELKFLVFFSTGTLVLKIVSSPFWSKTQPFYDL